MEITTFIFVLFLLPPLCSSLTDPYGRSTIHADTKTMLAIIGAVVGVIVVGYLVFYFRRIISWFRGPQINPPVPPQPNVPLPNIESSIPRQLFSEFRGNIEEPEPEEMDCAICISHFTEEDMVRALPGCGHAFHTECIDGWLAGNRSCPVCRENVQV